LVFSPALLTPSFKSNFALAVFLKLSNWRFNIFCDKLLIFNILEFFDNTNYSKSLSNQSTTWKVGLGLSYPIGGIEADSNLKKTNMELEILVLNSSMAF
jgi:hypothetical protein